MSSLKFGTSGLRGLVEDLNGPAATLYAQAFATVLKARGAHPGAEVLLGRDLRASSPAIAARAAEGVMAAGLVPIDCGALPTPALALAGMSRGVASIMVTGSHIPDDRNGLKFYRHDGEIDKQDEAAIWAAHAALAGGPPQGLAVTGAAPATFDAVAEYLARYRAFFPPGCLRSLRIGVYQHSSVARDVLVKILQDLGADVLPLGRATAFIPVDTEAVREEDVGLARGWAAEHGFDALVSTDGDADRPLMADADGLFLRGDLLCVLAARHLGIATIVTPVTSNSRLEKAGAFRRVLRTKVGSPFVIAGLEEARDTGENVLGFEANGGLLLGSSVERAGRSLPALLTRDALLPILAVLESMVETGRGLRSLADGLGFATALSTRVENVPEALTAPFLNSLRNAGADRDGFFKPLGGVRSLDATDGLRFTTLDDEIVHFRASGNAPELRVYVEAMDAARAQILLGRAVEAASHALQR